MKCPVCNKDTQLPDDDQPQSGTHAYTIKFSCGTELDCAYDADIDEYSFGQKCNEERKLSGSELIDEMIKTKKKREWEAINFEGPGFPQSDIHRFYEIFGYMVKALDDAPIGKRGAPIINAPDLLKSVLRQGKGHLNPNEIIKLIQKLDKGFIF